MSSVFLLTAAFCLAAEAANCELCAKIQAQISSIEVEIKDSTSLLGGNQEYLTRVDPKQLSKVIKVRSNIMMILVRIAAQKKKVMEMKNQLQKEGCETCPK